MKQEDQRIPQEQWDKMSPEERKKVIAQRKKQAQADGTPWKNDWSFYAVSEQIAKDIGSIPYNVIPGVAKQLETSIWNVVEETTPTVSYNDAYRNMGAMLLSYILTPGVGSEKVSGINMAATQLYTFIRRANSGARNYEAADLIMYVLEMAEIYATFFEAKRALGIARMYSIENHNIPDMLLTLLGITPSDIRSNIAQYRGRLNVLAAKINAFAVPSYFKYFDRLAYISSKVFADSTSIRGQFYMFHRGYYRLWSPKTSTQGSELVARVTPGGSAPVPFSQVLNTLEEMINAMFLDDDINTMSGDILKAFGGDKCYGVVDVPDDYLVVPQMDEDILAQIENCVPLERYGGSGYGTNSLNIKQNVEGQYVVFNPTVLMGNGVLAFECPEFLFNSHKDNPDYKDTLEWTRLIAVASKSGTGGDAVMAVTACGQELVLSCTMAFYYQGQVNLTSFRTVILQVRGSSGDVGSTDPLTLVYGEQFDWHPFVYVYTVLGSTAAPTEITNYDIAGDTKKYTFIQQETVINIHKAAMTAEFWADDLYKVAASK